MSSTERSRARRAKQPPRFLVRPGTVLTKQEIGLRVRQQKRRAEAAERGPLFKRLTAEADHNTMLDELTVLSVERDPYRLDTPAERLIGKWFADQMAQFVPTGTVHLRGLHYRLAADGKVRKPNGRIYVNSEADWIWLADTASKAARWLGYVPFERIIDERNEPPEVLTIDDMVENETWLARASEAVVPDPDELMPRPDCQTNPRQPFRIILVGEKSSLRQIPLPFAQQVAGELILPSGDISDTLIYDMAKRAAADDRRAICLYFSDCDPSGFFMPPILARKLQAHRDLEFKDLDVAVYPVALSFEQADRLDLPSTPLKDTELRADNWKARWGREQTEIDALAALQPEVLEQITRDALAPFFDFTLADRIADAEQQWRENADDALEDDPRYDGARALMDTARNSLEATAEVLSRMQAAAHQVLSDVALPAFEPPEPEIDAEAPEPLFDSNDEWRSATRKLIEYRRLGGDDEEPTK